MTSDSSRPESPKAPAEGLFLGASNSAAEVRRLIARAAKVDSTVLVTGESGTGKELVARRIHLAAHEERGKGYAPFIGINCTAIPENLIESELFGYDTGAFTDAKADKKGVFEQAENGTLLLDEIGDMPRGLQGRLLRVLEERALRRLGGREEIRIDCTVVASTNRDLKAEVAQGRFRKDLYYRLNTFSLDVPPLRKRGNDIIELAEHFLSWFSIRYGKKEPYVLSESCKRKLMGYPWPGNVRELRNVIERIVVLESARLIEPKHLPREIGADRCERNASGHILELPEDGLDFEALKRDLIVQALEKAGHNKMKAARLLGVSYDTLRYQLKRFGLH